VVIVRFAPSPTGYLHVGGARTALFNFLFARNQKGKFLLRIEDTDRERSQPEFEKEILDSLTWLGLAWEGQPFRQSERIPVYQKEAEALLSKGLAYEEVKEGKRAVRFRTPKREVRFTDGLRGEVSFNTELFDDLVLLKSDGYPTYHWACVVDDHEMGITDVIRGEDHLTNTPKQMLLIEALGWKPPRYVHLPLILGSDGTPLSKRHGAVAVTQYQKDGFLPEGLVNYLALLGWGPEGNQEFFPLSELIKKFSLKRLIRSAARFDPEKLRWVNGQHLRALSETDYLKRVRDYYAVGAGTAPLPAGVAPDKFDRIALLFKSRIQTLKDLVTEASYAFRDVETYDLDAMNRALGAPELRTKLLDLKRSLEPLPDFEDSVKLEAVLRESAVRQGTEAKVLIHPLRLALTGKGVSPGIFELMRVLGKEVCLKRLDRLVEKL
jgi:glutamyl-tRNA synthetase